MNHFCVVSLLAGNSQCVLLVDSNCTDLLVCLSMTFFIVRCPFIDAGDVVSGSEKYI